MDLGAVKAATEPELAAAAAAAARNAGDLVRDAEVLAGVHSTARAYGLAALAVEEVGKAVSLAKLAGMPDALKARAPVGRMLAWHQLKQATGPFDPRGPWAPHRPDPVLVLSACQGRGWRGSRLNCVGPGDAGLGRLITLSNERATSAPEQHSCADLECGVAPSAPHSTAAADTPAQIGHVAGDVQLGTGKPRSGADRP